MPLRRSADTGAGALARRFGDILRVGDGAAAEALIADALATGMAPDVIQARVIAPAMVWIGELWESRAIGVADEHLATAISQRALIGLFEAMSGTGVRARSRERVLLAAVEGQHHTLGLRMVGDVLEAAGFDVLYLGEDVPVDSLRAFVIRHQPAVAGLAVGIAADAACLADSLWAIHELDFETRIVLGGRAIPPAFQTAGYPCVTDSMDIVGAVEAVLAGPPQRLPAAVNLMRSSRTRPLQRFEPEPESDAIAATLAKAAEQGFDVARRHVRRAEAYRDLAMRDPLTDLANRRAFEDELNTLDGGGALLMIDVDVFKAVNDEQGHAAGDRLLRSIGQVIGDSVRPGDLAARIGGDEFAVVLPDATASVAAEIGERIRVAVAVSGVSVSVGVATLTGDTRGSLLTADAALYQAKAAGRDRVSAACDPVYVSMSRLAIPPERAPELVAAFKARARLADQADGFVDLQVWQSDRDAGEILMVSRWRDRAAFTAYMRSAEHKVSHDRIDPDLKSDIRLRRLDHLHTYRVVAD